MPLLPNFKIYMYVCVTHMSGSHGSVQAHPILPDTFCPILSISSGRGDVLTI